MQFPHHTCTQEAPHIGTVSTGYFQNLSIRIERNEMAGACSAYGEGEGRIQGLGAEA
jgi:hypothetical protein